MSAFYFESVDKQMYMEAAIWTKSKFLGMSIGVVMVGKSGYCRQVARIVFATKYWIVESHKSPFAVMSDYTALHVHTCMC